MNLIPKKDLNEDAQKIIDACHHDPFSVLGRHEINKNTLITVFLPHAESVRIANKNLVFTRIPDTDLFVCDISRLTILGHYLLDWTDKNDQRHQQYDPYDFGEQLSSFDLHLFGEGKNSQIYNKLGAHLHTVDSIDGVLFSVWAPNAARVSVVGNFNHWDGRYHPMRSLGSSGVWEIFIPGLTENSLYKFEILNRQSKQVLTKTDPFGQQFECRPNTSSIVVQNNNYEWQDNHWMHRRRNNNWLQQPYSVYEVHLGSWKRDEQGNFLNYRRLAKLLVEYVKDLGFTHIELLPITEHPLDMSWGYQTTGYFAPTSRHGNTDDFRFFVDYCHQHEIGIILDWAPAHFPKDDFALAQFDGSPLYEHADPRQGEHRDWGTLIFNYGRNEVKNFLLSSAVFWLQEYHIDGLRVDAVASMLYLDYSREQDDWIPNQHGGNENIAAIEFMQELNTLTHDQFPGTVIIAEESTSWPQVTRPTWTGGLGFSMKWSMGWMHDILDYISRDPVHRKHHHDQLSFVLTYAFTENFMLPFSHDEVVHGKGSLLEKMPGDEWQRFANLRLLYTLMYTYPGKKLLFMGCEFGQSSEWDFDQSLAWHELEYPHHYGMKTLIKDLNHIYKTHPALYQHDFESKGFEWINSDDAERSVLCYMRLHAKEALIIVLNFTPVPRANYRIGVPNSGTYYEILNSDSSYYDGSNIGNSYVTSEPIACGHWQNSVCLTVPPLAGIILKL